MKKVFSLLSICLVSICLFGCNKEDVDNSEVIPCLNNTLGGYISTENTTLEEVSLGLFTDKDDKVTEYRAGQTSEEDIYAIVETKSYEVSNDFELYFNGKFKEYQTYSKNNVYVYVHSNNGDIDLEDIKKCFE